MRRNVLATLLVLTAMAAPVVAAPIPFLVDSCGEIVPPKAAAYLAGDLDCSGSSAINAVELGKKASFDLAGFTITTGALYGIRCDFGKCVIKNGTVTGAGVVGIVGMKTTLENMTVAMSGTFSAALDNGAKVLGSTIAGTAITGIYAINKNSKVSLIDSTVTGHARFGIWAPRIALVGSTVTDNMNDPACAVDALCADLVAQHRPKLKSATCGRSTHLPDEPIYPDCLGWCVCTDD